MVWEAIYDNIVWKGISTVRHRDNTVALSGTLLRGSRDRRTALALCLTTPAGSGDGSFFAYGRAELYLGSTLYDGWVRTGRAGAFDRVHDHRHSVVFRREGWIEGIELEAREVVPITVTFRFDKSPRVPSTFLVDLTQFGAGDDATVAHGNEQFEIRYDPAAGSVASVRAAHEF